MSVPCPSSQHAPFGIVPQGVAREQSVQPSVKSQSRRGKTIRRPIRVEGDIAFVPLTKGYTAIIDAADVPLVDGFNWSVNLTLNERGDVRAAYAARGVKGKGLIRMHRLIFGAPPGMIVDHIDGNTLNNRRANLRMASQAQNTWNSRRRAGKLTPKGVQKCGERWRATIFRQGERHHLGVFESPDDAAAAYREASARLHGEFGRVE